MTDPLEVARELLARTRNISACLDSMVRPHHRVLELKDELSGEPFAELDHTREVLLAELGSIEGLLSKGLVNEGWSAISAYETRVGLLVPSLRRLAGARRGVRATGASAAMSTTLAGIEDKILEHDLVGADGDLRAFEHGMVLPPIKAATTRDEDTVPCVLCGRAVRADLDLCPYCGWDPGALSAECPECGSTVLQAFRACPSCGKELPGKGRQGRTLIPPLVVG